MVSRRKVKKAEKMQRKNQGMTLEEAYKILDTAPSLVSNSVYEEALKVMEREDAGFAAEIRAFNEAKAKEDALRVAYEIAGGYKTNVISKKRFENAIKLVTADDPEFARTLQALSENGMSFKDADSEHLAQAEQTVIQNAQLLEKEYRNSEQLKQEVFTDDVRELMNNTVVEGVSQEDAEQIIFVTGQQDALQEIAERADLENVSDDEKHQIVVDTLQDAVRGNLLRSRAENTPLRDAVNSSKKVKVSSNSVFSAFKQAAQRANAYLKDLGRRGWKKAAALFNRAKTFVCEHPKTTLASTAFILAASSLVVGYSDKDSHKNQDQMPTEQKTVVLNDTTKTSAAIVSDTIRSDSIPVLEVAPVAQSAVADTTRTTTLKSVTQNATKATVKKGATVNAVKASAIEDNFEIVAKADTAAVEDDFEIVTKADTAAVEDDFEIVTKAGKAAVEDDFEIVATADDFEITTDNPTVQADSIVNKVVLDHDSIPAGTPSAMYTAERGGVDGSGLSSDALKKDQKWYDNTFYKGAYQDFVELLRKDENLYLFNKGNVGEGVTPEILLHKHAAQARWGNDKYGEFATTITAMNQFLNGCVEQLDVTKAEQIKAVMDRVNTDGTIDGVVGKQNVRNLSIKYNGCGETMTYDATYSADPVRPTNPSGEKYQRLYMMSDTIRRKAEPITVTYEYSTQLPQQQVQISVAEYRGNHEKGQGLTDGKKIRDLSADVVDSLSVTDRQIASYQSEQSVDQQAPNGNINELKGNFASGEGLNAGVVVDTHKEVSVSVNDRQINSNQEDNFEIVTADKRSHANTPGKAKKGGVKKKSKKQIEQEALDMARADYFRIRMQSSNN